MIIGLFSGLFGQSDMLEPLSHNYSEDYNYSGVSTPQPIPMKRLTTRTTPKPRKERNLKEVNESDMNPILLNHLSNKNQTNVRNLCFSSNIGFQSSRSLEENCFLNTKNSHILSAYETMTIDRNKMISTLRLNWSSLMSAISCHFTEWYLKTKVNFFVRNYFLGTIKTICSNSRLVMFFTVFHKYCKCLILKTLI